MESSLRFRRLHRADLLYSHLSCSTFHLIRKQLRTMDVLSRHRETWSSSCHAKRSTMSNTRGQNAWWIDGGELAWIVEDVCWSRAGPNLVPLSLQLSSSRLWEGRAIHAWHIAHRVLTTWILQEVWDVQVFQWLCNSCSWVPEYQSWRLYQQYER